MDNITSAIGDHPHVGEVRGLGLLCGVEYVKDKSTKEPFDPSQKVGDKILNAAIERGLFSRVRGDVFCLAPPIVIEDSELDRLAAISAGSDNRRSGDITRYPESDARVSFLASDSFAIGYEHQPLVPRYKLSSWS